MINISNAEKRLYNMHNKQKEVKDGDLYKSGKSNWTATTDTNTATIISNYCRHLWKQVVDQESWLH